MNLATADYKTNPLEAFVRANLAMRVKKNDLAIEALSMQVEKSPPIPYLDYLIGIAKLQRGDGNAAFYLARYIREYKGEHYIKDAWLKLGWAFLLAGDKKHFENAMTFVAADGTAQLEEDKNAAREALLSKDLVLDILRARLYFDGGYFDKAQYEMKLVNPAKLANDLQKAEYYYRNARILDALKDVNNALKDYLVVIDKY